MKLTDEEKTLIRKLRQGQETQELKELLANANEERRELRLEVSKFKIRAAKAERQVPPRTGDICTPLQGSQHHPKCPTAIRPHERPIWYHGGQWRVMPREGDVCVPGSMRHTPRIHHESCEDTGHPDARTYSEGYWRLGSAE